jgi:predicted secreted protein
MTPAVAVGVYFICWWLVLFAILPIGVKVAEKSENEPLGHADSAPVEAHILWKFAITTVVSAVVFAIIYAVITWHLVPYELLPSSLY